jgi:hypothetical protein
MITSYEVEFGPEIGSGGLYVFCILVPTSIISHCVFISGKVFKGKWNNAMVALKVLVIENGIAPSPTVRQKLFTLIPLMLISDYSLSIMRSRCVIWHCKCGLDCDLNQIWSTVQHPNVVRKSVVQARAFEIHFSMMAGRTPRCKHTR